MTNKAARNLSGDSMADDGWPLADLCSFSGRSCVLL